MLRSVARRVLPTGLTSWLRGVVAGCRRLTSYPAMHWKTGIDYETYWEAKFANHGSEMSSWRLRRIEAIANIIDPGASVLDIGAGDGGMMKHLVERRQVRGLCVDISQQAVDYCRQQGLAAECVDVNEPGAAAGLGQFDHVMLLELIEHLPSPELLLETLRPIVRRSFIISIPNTGYFRHRLRLAMGRFPLQWVTNPGEHLRFWTLTDFRWWAHQLGYRLVAAVPYEGTPLLRLLWPSMYAAGFIYVLECPQARPTDTETSA